jgi:hypothetical protein
VGTHGAQGAAGPQGAIGPQGARGASGTASTTIKTDSFSNAKTGTVTCAPNSHALGGGGNVTMTSQSVNAIVASFPSNQSGVPVTTGMADSWTVAVVMNGSGSVYVICAPDT